MGIDLLPTEPIEGAILLQQDFTSEDAAGKIKALLNGPVDVVMSDMAANTTGVQNVDHLRTLGLVEMAYEFAKEVLVEGFSRRHRKFFAC